MKISFYALSLGVSIWVYNVINTTGIFDLVIHKGSKQIWAAITILSVKALSYVIYDWRNYKYHNVSSFEVSTKTLLAFSLFLWVPLWVSNSLLRLESGLVLMKIHMQHSGLSDSNFARIIMKKSELNFPFGIWVWLDLREYWQSWNSKFLT